MPGAHSTKTWYSGKGTRLWTTVGFASHLCANFSASFFSSLKWVAGFESFLKSLNLMKKFYDPSMSTSLHFRTSSKAQLDSVNSYSLSKESQSKDQDHWLENVWLSFADLTGFKAATCGLKLDRIRKLWNPSSRGEMFKFLKSLSLSHLCTDSPLS